MNFTAEQLQNNWNIFLSNIDAYISEPRRTQLKEFYKKFEERIIIMPASHKKEYHGAWPGGYVDHVNRVVRCSLKQLDLWESEGANVSDFTIEELIFSAINHDLGKIGDYKNESYITQTDKWRKEKLGEDYTFNPNLEFCSVPDRGLFLLQDNGIKYSLNEMITIQTHDGLYDEGNKKYLMSYIPENKPRTCMPYILHQADLMAARIEFEQYFNPILKDKLKKEEVKNNLDTKEKNYTLNPKLNTYQKSLKTYKSSKLDNSLGRMLDNLKN